MSGHNKKLLEQVFSLFVADLKDRLEHGEVLIHQGAVATDGAGQPLRVRPAAATLNVIRQLLKDNGIDALATKGNDLGRLAALLSQASLPDAGDEDAVDSPH